MGWLARDDRSSRSSAERSGESPGPGPVERSAPGVAAVLEGVSTDGTHSVLDLGPAAGSSLEVYGRFARWVRFADLLSAGSRNGRVSALEKAVPAQPDRPYDLIFAWTVIDRLSRAGRSRLMERLEEVSSADARLHLVVRAAEGGADAPPLRFALLDVDRVQCRAAGGARTSRGRLLPAEVEELLDPFRVIRGFTLKGGLREYAAVRRRDG